MTAEPLVYSGGAIWASKVLTAILSPDMDAQLVDLPSPDSCTGRPLPACRSQRRQKAKERPVASAHGMDQTRNKQRKSCRVRAILESMFLGLQCLCFSSSTLTDTRRTLTSDVRLSWKSLLDRYPLDGKDHAATSMRPRLCDRHKRLGPEHRPVSSTICPYSYGPA